MPKWLNGNEHSKYNLPDGVIAKLYMCTVVSDGSTIWKLVDSTPLDVVLIVDPLPDYSCSAHFFYRCEALYYDIGWFR